MSRLPALRPRELIAALKKDGFIESHQTGSHLSLVHSDGRRVIIPIHAKDIPRGTMSAIIKRTGLTDDRIRELL